MARTREGERDSVDAWRDGGVPTRLGPTDREGTRAAAYSGFRSGSEGARVLVPFVALCNSLRSPTYKNLHTIVPFPAKKLPPLGSAARLPHLAGASRARYPLSCRDPAQPPGARPPLPRSRPLRRPGPPGCRAGSWPWHVRPLPHGGVRPPLRPTSSAVEGGSLPLHHGSPLRVRASGRVPCIPHFPPAQPTLGCLMIALALSVRTPTLRGLKDTHGTAKWQVMRYP
ncbi:PREDICTED: uncharacterized protein LOC105512431 [Colobus angolensis palliatus]|uniref:uncharacterized protein LOC105512431 n=1 Tax=Colobus angolensis palliatus TaxID=336983 RepID=UPI0005F37D1E|nr:PREDICTED: uncharacterized protein LOC105512431 [Colobus angolensis palliatus]